MADSPTGELDTGLKILDLVSERNLVEKEIYPVGYF
jgi:hypothetical protein